MKPELRILIVAESASARFGGEAALPLHYFRVLRKLGHPVWLLTHARTRDELSALYPGEAAIVYVEDTLWNRAMWAIGRRMPGRLSHFTVGFMSRLATQLSQRRVAREIVRRERITIVHQPSPVSPREPSLLHGLGAPVVIGPMNGGMNFPPGFARKQSRLEGKFIATGRAMARGMNVLMPGKRKAALLLVANERTRLALPDGVCSNVAELVENGVDLDLWNVPAGKPPAQATDVTRFVYLGRLVEWKAIDLLLQAFGRACKQAPMHLTIIGDGEQRARLESMAQTLGLGPSGQAAGAGVTFTGWLTQAQCAQRLGENDALVLPSLIECGGAVVLEAMALGKPVIATAWGGPVDYVDASCGILVPPTRVEAFVDGLADAMARLASAPEEARAMGLAGRSKVEREYDWDVKVAQMLRLYESVRSPA